MYVYHFANFLIVGDFEFQMCAWLQKQKAGTNDVHIPFITQIEDGLGQVEVSRFDSVWWHPMIWVGCCCCRWESEAPQPIHSCFKPYQFRSGV